MDRKDGFHQIAAPVVPGADACILPVTASEQPVPLAPPQLDQLVAHIALYRDPLLPQILTASTYWSEIPEDAIWAHHHSYLKGDALARAIQADHLQRDPSVLVLLPFPSVLDMMARDPSWTEQLGNAVLTQNPDVMDANTTDAAAGVELRLPEAERLHQCRLARQSPELVSRRSISGESRRRA